MGNYLYPKQSDDNKKSEEINEDYISKEITYKEELISNIKYFNVFWYDPNNSNDFEYFQNYFQNVRFIKGTNLESVIQFFNKESSSDEWIVVTPGSKGEELIKNLKEYKCIHAFFVFCWNIELHKDWANNIKKVKCLTSNPEILLQKFVELNKEYLIPNFVYNDNNKNEIYNDFDLFINSNEIKSDNKFALNSVKRELKTIIDNINRSKNKYSNLCMKSYHYLKGKNCLKDYKEPVPDENSVLYTYVKLFKTFNDERIEYIIKFMLNTILLSLYFHQYKYLFNLLSYDEVKSIFKKEVDQKEVSLKESKVIPYINKLAEKIMKQKSILMDKYELKEIQKYYILMIFNNFILCNKKDFIKFYQLINFLRDFDLCSKIFVYYNFAKFNNKNYNFFEDFSAVYLSDMNDERVSIFMECVGDEDITSEEISEENKRIIKNSLTIKDFLILGNEKFKKNIKSIESKLEVNSLKYLKIEEIPNYIKEKNKKDKLRIYFYYIILTYDEIQKNLEKLISISAEIGITFSILLFIEKDIAFIPKNYIKNNILISITLVYSIEDIINYFSASTRIDFSSGLAELLSDYKIIKSTNKEIIEEDEEKDCQDGCFELAETFDDKIVKNKTIISFNDELDYSSISQEMYNIYKEHNALDIFFNQNILYFGFNIEVDIKVLDICFIKRILYMYCREEMESRKSFYRMINDDLRTKDPHKIDKFIILLGLIYKLIENKELASYKGKVYRATKLDEDLILKLKSGTIMINTTFWSTTKNFKVAEHFMENNSWRNAYIICETMKINIDIDNEKLNPFDEEEVLILPFTEFKVEKIHSEIKYGKKIYIIQLCELENKYFVNYKNMNVETINDLTFSELAVKYLSQKKI